MPRPVPVLVVYDHQSAHAVDCAALLALAERALPLCLECRGPEAPALPGLDEIEVTVVDDPTLAQVHGEFLDDCSPTDVITFQHGEILLSADTAARESAARNQPILHELALYVIHGLLHLNGHTDVEAQLRARMHAAQDEILAKIWAAATNPKSELRNSKQSSQLEK